MTRRSELRTARRVPMQCKVRITLLEGLGPSQYGVCTELSVSGMTLLTSYVPQAEEVFDVLMLPPQREGQFNAAPLAARVQVKRCHELVPGKSYELGVEIIALRSGPQARLGA